MGCDIHSHLERRKANGEWEYIPSQHPFGDRSYNRFAFLAGVRNNSEVTPISEPRGFPDDASKLTWDFYRFWQDNAHSASWLTLDELEAFDYDNTFVNDARDDGARCTMRSFLGEGFFHELALARYALGERIVFWFDN